MCGIAGFFDSSINSNDAECFLGAMLQAIYHRGPDGEGRLVDSGLGIYAGMRRLSIIDLAGGDQPIWNESRKVAVLFNGEIYNYRELREDLIAKGHRFYTSSDTEVLVHLYEEHGELMTKYLRGMFVFLILDLYRKCVILARDCFGQKPLYYTHSGERFAFGSEMKSLRKLPWVDWSEQEDAYLMYLTWLSLPAPYTHFTNIRKLEPGTTLRFDLSNRGKTHISEAWNYLQQNDQLQARLTTSDIENALSESVRLHLRSDVPVGVFLSGGLDSKLIATLASREMSAPLQAFTAVFDGVDSEESEATATAKLLRLPHHIIEIQYDHFAERLVEVLHQLDEPIGDPAAFAVYQLAKYARDHVKVVLSGEGADELFGGYYGRYSGMLETIQRSKVLKNFAVILPLLKEFPTGRIDSLLMRGRLSVLGEIAWMRREGLMRMHGGNCVFFPDQQQRILAYCESLSSKLINTLSSSDLLEQCLAWDLRWQLPESLLQKADKMTMANSLELRAPFLDTRVAKVAANLRQIDKIDLHSGVGKSILRQVMIRLDPEENKKRPKKGFPMPFANWFKTSLKDEIESTLFNSNSMAMNRLNPMALKFAWNRFQSGYDDSSMQAFYALWSYELWRNSMSDV